MAKYSYNELERAASEGRRIGGWQGTDVYSCSKYEYNAALPHFYVLYDDGNKLVRKGLVYGSINDKGTIHEVDTPYTYYKPKKKNKREEYKVPATQYSAYTAGARGNDVEVPVDVEDFFVRIDKEINELLANAGKVDLSVDFGLEAKG